MCQVPGLIEDYEKQRRQTYNLYEQIHQFQRPLSYEDFALAWTTAEYPRTIRERLAEALYVTACIPCAHWL